MLASRLRRDSRQGNPRRQVIIDAAVLVEPGAIRVEADFPALRFTE
jgi:hypothetical protein